ncbi:uncharacterized protein LOC124149674 [Haliotis rufescens]|uniref:uncharacterized protein LOC124149674 n=1 Tax=Haliotis rufescens TaxID=6454 RepID=UPI00201F4E3A|nr:uncharacterized protein LOC124149674 [Haliotis rufescens]
MAKYYNLVALNIVIIFLFFTLPILSALFIVLLSPLVNTVLLLSITDAITYTYPTEVSPRPWVFFIWAFIFIWQIIWIFYSMNLSYRVVRGGPSVLLTSVFLGIFILSLLLHVALNIAAVFVLVLAFVFLILLSASLFACLALSYKSLYDNRQILADQQRGLDDSLVRGLVHNGLGLYATWTLIAALINIAVLMTYRSNPPIDQSTASTVSLAFIAAFLVVYFITDLTVFDKYSRYTFTPYVALLWALVAILVNNVDFRKHNTIFTAVLLGLTGLSLIVKIVVVCVKKKTNPLFPDPTAVKDTVVGHGGP